ncbi:MAG TPA: shikimate dehydrogenase [Actinobacteria bacterium]|nr:shikimate dehydrogenase [Actinomycetota bacterium]
MRKFAFLVHPLDLDDVVSFEKKSAGKPVALIKKLLLWLCERPPFIGSHITGINSNTGRKAEGWFINVPLLPEQMKEHPELAKEKILEAVSFAKELGASIVGLGGFTSIATNSGLAIAKEAPLPITTGNSYTVVAAVEGTRKAARLMGIRLSKAKLAIVGATGSIGRACSEILAPQVSEIILVGRRPEVLQLQADKLKKFTNVSISMDIKKALKDADVVISASSDANAIIDANDLEPGMVVCDVAQPPDVSKSVLKERNDILVFDGGIIKIPGIRIRRKSKFDYDFKLKPDKYAYACMAETMILCLEGVNENFDLGSVKVSSAEKISKLAAKHGFKLAGFRSFGEKITRDKIKEIRRNAALKSNKKWFYRVRRMLEYSELG